MTIEPKAFGKMTSKTGLAYVGSRALGLPFWVMLNTLSIILYKEFHISPFFVTLFIILKPASALLATYWSSFWKEKKLVSNLIVTNILRFLPFLTFFFINSPAFMLVCFCIYMTLSRGAVPAWMEILKKNIPGAHQSRILALGNAIEYFGMTLFPLFVGILLDINPASWRVLFPVTAALGLLSTFFFYQLPFEVVEPQEKEEKTSLLLPWKKGLQLLKNHPDFAIYQLGFMLGGAGLMIIQPVLPFFFVDILDLSYTEMILAITICKGIGFSLSSNFWAGLFQRIHILRFSAFVALTASFFPLLLFSAKWSLLLLFGAYLLYGFMQAGSELSWHLSAVTFSKEKPSLSFSETNMLTVGIRGCIIPLLGHSLFSWTNSSIVMIMGSLLCLLGSCFLFYFQKSSSKENYSTQ